MDNQRLKQQLDFIIETDKVKQVLRKTPLFDGSRFENDGEHGWTIALMAALLREYANFPVNLEKVMLMLLIHDVVEIDAGDVFLYSEARKDVHQKELKAARRIFGILPEDQAGEYLEIWQEFEARQSNEAKYASVFDRLEPLLQNYCTQGASWKKHSIKAHQVRKGNAHIQEGSQEIWRFVEQLIQESVEKGWLEE